MRACDDAALLLPADALPGGQDERIVVDAIAKLDTKLAALKEVEAEIVRRKNMKREYDYYVQKVREIKQKGTNDPQKLMRVRGGAAMTAAAATTTTGR